MYFTVTILTSVFQIRTVQFTVNYFKHFDLHNSKFERVVSQLLNVSAKDKSS